jgi:uncharacterized membrane protein
VIEAFKTHAMMYEATNNFGSFFGAKIFSKRRILLVIGKIYLHISYPYLNITKKISTRLLNNFTVTHEMTIFKKFT